MTGHERYADHAWAQAMFADLQRQIDELTAQLAALTNLIHAHTMTALNPPPSEPDGRDG